VLAIRSASSRRPDSTTKGARQEDIESNLAQQMPHRVRRFSKYATGCEPGEGELAPASTDDDGRAGDRERNS
jgi:hypothetical protein